MVPWARAVDPQRCGAVREGADGGDADDDDASTGEITTHHNGAGSGGFGVDPLREGRDVPHAGVAGHREGHQDP